MTVKTTKRPAPKTAQKSAPAAKSAPARGKTDAKRKA